LRAAGHARRDKKERFPKTKARFARIVIGRKRSGEKGLEKARSRLGDEDVKKGGITQKGKEEESVGIAGRWKRNPKRGQGFENAKNRKKRIISMGNVKKDWGDSFFFV